MQKIMRSRCRRRGAVPVFLLCAVLLLTGCSGITAPSPTASPNSQGGIVLATKAPENPTDGQETAAATATPETGADRTPAPETQAGAPATDAPPTGAPPTEASATATPYVNKFLDVNADPVVYMTPGQTVSVDIGDGDPASWRSGNDSVIRLSAENGALKAEALGTGYSVLTGQGSRTGRILVYSMQPAERTENNKVRDGLPYYLYYEKESHTLTVYKADSEGYYTVPCRTICAACGSTPSKTPTGIHTLGEKVRWKKFSDSLYASYGIAYASGVWLHGTCFNEEKPNTIVSSYYNTIGENSTGGCIRMQVGHIYWIYENCPEGTLLEIVNGAPRGTASIKPDPIPEAAAYDPTDPVLAG